MNYMTKTAVSILIGMTIFSTETFANAQMGQKIYLKKMKKSCGISGVNFARQHTQDEWEAIKEAGKFGIEITKLCSKLKLDKKYENDVYDFSYQYARDSGNVPL